jgi:RNA recognition motif-containing protein
MIKNLYVGNLPYSTTPDELREEFSRFGTVTRAQIIADRETGRSRGFGFVEMADGAEEAINALNGAIFQGRALTVNEAKPRESRGSGSPGGYRHSPPSYGNYGSGRGARY